MWGISKIRSTDAEGHVLARFGSAQDFIVGVDNSFVHLSRELQLTARRKAPTVTDVDANALINLGLLGTTHLIDCSSEDPSQYRFLQYGNRIAIHDGKEYSGRTLRDAEWPMMRVLAERDYAYAKKNGAATLSQVEVLRHDRQIVYRRFIIPLAGNRGEITHLLVATRPNLLKIVPSSFD
jgi:hypothetical protein